MDFKIGATTQYVDFISNPEFWAGLPRPLGWPQTKTILAGQPYPWVGQTSQMSSKSVILAFRLTFVSCVEALLKWRKLDVNQSNHYILHLQGWKEKYLRIDDKKKKKKVMILIENNHSN